MNTFSIVAGSPTTLLNTNPTGQHAHPSSLGFFTDAASRGQALPTDNQPSGSNLVYTGDVGTRVVGGSGLVFASGVCLCTGVMADDDPLVGFVPTGLAAGVEGPNNGTPIGTNPFGTPSETSYWFETETSPTAQRYDLDFAQHCGIAPFPAGSADASALTFQVQVYERGFLEFTFVYGSDEYPAQVEDTFNDTFVFLVTKSGGATTNLATNTVGGVAKGFNLADIIDCPTQIFRKNQTPAAPSALVGSPAMIPPDAQGNPHTEYYDHEYAGFTAPLKRGCSSSQESTRSRSRSRTWPMGTSIRACSFPRTASASTPRPCWKETTTATARWNKATSTS